MARKTRPTEPDTTHHPDAVTRSLTPAQSCAVLLLAAGRTDAETAAELGVHRCTVSQWKNHHPAFIAQLNRTRDSVNAELADRFRVLASSALRVIGEALEGDDSPARTAAAFALLKRVPLTTAVAGPRHADEVVYAETARRLAATPINDKFVNPFDLTAPPLMTKRFAATAHDLYALADAEPAGPRAPRAVANADIGRESASVAIPD